MLTKPSPRLLLRTAQRIHKDLTRRMVTERTVDFPETFWQELRLSSRRVALAQELGWFHAAAKCRNELERSLVGVQLHLENCRLQIEEARRPVSRLSVRDIWKDLVALEQEFEETQADLKERTLSVVTDRIVLEGIDLGRFQIVLAWDQGPAMSTYAVVALDPNPAATNPSVAHPHVQGERLCEGEGRAAIGQALEQGRFLDFFLLVRQVLETYGEDSAYVPLERWNGTQCEDCGQLVAANESTVCERCDSEICDDCSSSCGSCGRCCCGQCRSLCHACDEGCCTPCLHSCRTCEECFCSECLAGGQCQCCRERERECEKLFDDQNTPATKEAADAAIHPLRLGEAIVSA